MEKIRTKIFKGAATALITPFKSGEIDFETLGILIDRQIDSGISAIVVCGTTGEASTLSVDEHLRCIEFAVIRADKRIPVIAGSGSNSFEKAKYLSMKSCELGADALLAVTPYYNKTNTEGLIKYYSDIAEASSKPIILYNVPSRTGLNIPHEAYLRLSKCENIVGVKEASGNISSVARLASELGDDFCIYSGNDDQILPILSLGGCGVVSVLANIFPKETQLICEHYFKGETELARKLQLDFMDVINALFCEVNPIPLKYAMSLLGLSSSEVRAPLAQPSDTAKNTVRQALKNHGAI